MREDQRRIQFHPAAVPLVSISPPFRAYFPFSLFFLAIRPGFSGVSVFLRSLFRYLFAFCLPPRRVFSNFRDYSRRWVCLRVFPRFSLVRLAFDDAAIIDRFRTIRCYVRFIPTSKGGTFCYAFSYLYTYSVTMCVYHTYKFLMWIYLILPDCF